MTVRARISDHVGAIRNVSAQQQLALLQHLLDQWGQSLVTALALLLRLWRLGFHSVWFDEAVSLKWAAADPDYTWRTTMQLVEDKHPPLYYVALHYWQELLGLGGYEFSDWGLRLFGVLLGVATVWGLMLLVKRIDGPRVAMLTGLVAALSPILIWFSQELRMFSPATCALIWAAYFQARALETDATHHRIGYWALMSATLLAALYTYLFSAFLLPAAGLMLLVYTGQDRWRRFMEGVLALLCTGLLFLPLARNAWQVNSAESTPGQAFEHFGSNLLHLIQNATLWRVEWPPSLVSGLVGLTALIALAGLVLPARPTSEPENRRPNRDGRRWLWVWLGVGIVIANVMLSRSASIFTHDRYLLFLVPFLIWAIGRGIVQLSRRTISAGSVIGLTTVVAIACAVPQVWSSAHMREDWRSAANYIVGYQQASPHVPASVVVHVDYLHDALEWYIRQSATFEELPVFFPYGGTLSPDQVEDMIAPPLQGIVDFGSHTLWLVQSHLDGVDDNRLVEGWLAANYPLVTELYPSGIKVSGYMLRTEYETLPQPLRDSSFEPTLVAPGLTLAACEITTPRVHAEDARLHPPSGWVHVRLWLQAEDELQANYLATAQVIGPEGVWGDRLPGEGKTMRRWPTSTWSSGQYMREEVDINMNPLTPAGLYPVMVGVTTQEGTHATSAVRCGDVEILR